MARKEGRARRWKERSGDGMIGDDFFVEGEIKLLFE
jgi:hypothetical protein